ncbi:uncharacterized protein DS421_18g620180 [Arachis hypogaea]|nr:uncharacterized protein DS421_18g620180 [Arachis hypogaea]
MARRKEILLRQKEKEREGSRTTTTEITTPAAPNESLRGDDGKEKQRLQRRRDTVRSKEAATGRLTGSREEVTSRNDEE